MSNTRTNYDMPEVTPEMEKNHQVWVWLWDEPMSFEDALAGKPRGSGRWEVRGLGAIFEDEGPDCD